MTEVKEFFATTAECASDLARNFNSGSSGVSGRQSNSNNSNNNYNNSSGSGIPPSPGAALGVNQRILSSQLPDKIIDDLLEGITVHYAVHLISVLGHYIEEIRIKAVFLLFDLAIIFDRKTQTELKKRIPKVAFTFQSDDKGFNNPVHELFHFIAPPLSNMAIALVAGLECFFACVDWSVRGICISALTRIVYENEKIFQEEDQLSAIWNLYFSLGSIPLISKVFPDRVVIVRSLGLLANMYSSVDTTLTNRVISGLLRLEYKTKSEVEAVKSTVRKIFEKICEDIATASATASATAATSPAAIISGDKSVTTPTGGASGGLTLFLNMLTPRDEFAYDLLSWALENFALIKQLGKMKVSQQTTIPVQPHLLEFINSLSNHFKASSSLVRYGACLCLHACITLSPTLLESNKAITTYIVSGVLDSDYLTSYLYISMLELAATHWNRTDLLAAISKYKAEEVKDLNYDLKFSPVYSTMQSTTSSNLYDVLELALRNAAVVSTKLIHKASNALDYLSKPSKLRQLNLIRLWGSKLENFDSYLVQSLVPFLTNADEDIKIEALYVIQALVPTLKTALPSNIKFIWSSFSKLMNVRTKVTLLEKALNCIKSFPLDRLSPEDSEQLLVIFTRLVCHENPSIRLQVYQLIGSSNEFWKANSLFYASIGVLFLSLGDHNKENATSIINILISLFERSAFKTVIAPLVALRNTLGGSSIFITIRAFDDLANFVQKDRTELRDLVNGISQDSTVDEFWEFFLGDAPDNQLVRPDDYNYGRNFIHNPYWIAIMLTKISVPPPPLLLGDTVRRDVMPVTLVNKRRFICGFLFCLLPTCGMPDPVFRKAASVSSILCCFKSTSISVGILKGLLEYVSQQMLGHKQWSFQLTALEILKAIVRLKISGLCQAILFQYLDAAIDIAFNSPTNIVKIGAIELIEAFLLVFPCGITTKLSEIRDVIRALVVDKEEEVYKAALRVYPLVFRCVSTNQVKEFVDYLISEIRSIERAGPEAAGDPLISGLTIEEKNRVVCQSIIAMGAIPSPSSSLTIVIEILPFLTHKQHEYRLASFSAIISQFSLLDTVESTSVSWVFLPLCADLYQPIRKLFSDFMNKVPSPVQALGKALTAHPDDSYILSALTWDELLIDGAQLYVSSKNLAEVVVDLEELAANIFGAKSDSDDNSEFPTQINTELMQRIQQLSKSITGVVPIIKLSQVIYHLHGIEDTHPSKASSLLVLSELCCNHDGSLNEIMDILVTHLNRDLSKLDTPIVEAAILGLSNICEHSPAALKQLLGKIFGSVNPSEGEIMALLYWIKMIRDFAIDKAQELFAKFFTLATSQRYAFEKRIWCIHLTVELALLCGESEIAKTLEAVLTFVDTIDLESIREQVYSALASLIDFLGPKHALFRKILTGCKKDVKSNNPSTRLRALSMFQIIAKHVNPEDGAWLCCLLLADSCTEIRQKTKSILFIDGWLEFLNAQVIRNIKTPSAMRRHGLIDSLKLPSVELFGGSGRKLMIAETEGIPMTNSDPFNINYYRSERRKKFTNRYGVPEKLFAKYNNDTAPSLIEAIKAKIYKFSHSKWNTGVCPELMSYDTITILIEFVRKFRIITEELIDGFLQQIELVVGIGNGDKEDPEVDTEGDIHLISVVGTLVLAYDGIGDHTASYISRIQKIISTCDNKAKEIRESLYTDLESSFFFFNDFLDIPIVSEEQYASICAHKQAAQEAAMELVKLGRSEKLSVHDAQKNEMNEALDSKNDLLKRLIVLMLHCTSGYGLYYAMSKDCKDESMLEAVDFLAAMLENEHRGIRIAAVESIVTIVRTQLDSLRPRTVLVEKIRSIINKMLGFLENDLREPLYRRKADILHLMAELSVFTSDRGMHLSAVWQLMKLWRDPDSEVRLTAMKMTLMLGEAGMAEILEGLKVDNVDGKTNSPPSLMKEIATLLNNKEFMEKERLLDLFTLL